MREILFKAKHKGTGKWIEGFYCSLQETTYCFKEDYERFPVQTHHYIAQDIMTDWGLPNELRLFEIDPTTLCQFTGLTDKNGKKIWENDILFIIENIRTIVFQNGQYLQENKWVNKSNFKVEFTPGELMNTQRYANSPDITCEVIGNVFDNPELLT